MMVVTYFSSDERRRMDRQFGDVLNALKHKDEREEKPQDKQHEAGIINHCVTAFCWSYCAAVQDPDTVKRLDAAVRAAVKEFETEHKESGVQLAPLSDKVSVFQQFYGAAKNKWQVIEGGPFESLVHIFNLLVNFDKPVILTGGIESSLVCSAYEQVWSLDAMFLNLCTDIKRFHFTRWVGPQDTLYGRT